MKRLSRHFVNLMFAVITVTVALWVLFAGWGGHVDPRRWAVPAVAVLTYPAALIASAALAAALAVARCWRLLLTLVLAIVTTWPAFRVNVPLHAAIQPSGPTFSVLTFNVMGFSGETGDVNSTMRYILDSGADLVVLQEGQLGPTDFNRLPTVLPMYDEIEREYPYHSHGYHDLIILSRWPYKVYSDTTLRQGFGSPDNGHSEYHFYAKAFDIEMPGRQLRVINVHLQSIGLDDSDKQTYRNITHLDSVGDRSQMSRMRHSLLSKLSGAFRRRAGEAHQLRSIIDGSPANVVLCGDFNDTPASYAYWTVGGSDLHDAFAERGCGLASTFNKDKMLFHIDHILYRGDLRATSIRRDKAGTSDHYPQIATFEWLVAPEQ